jgi:type I restriction enzyme R subunit
MDGFASSEKALSQVPAMHLLQVLGYRLLTKSEVDRERRGRLSNVFLEDILASQLRRLNRIRFRGREVPFTEGNILAAIERLKAPRSSGLLKTNEDLTDLLLLGTSLDQTIDGETRGFQLRFIDWETPENNAFHVCAEFDVERSRTRETRRPDLVLFINGIPIGVIECKSPSTDVEQGISQHLRNQQDDEIPGLFRTIQLVLAANKNAARYGTVSTPAKFWSLWREREDKDDAVMAAVTTKLTVSQVRSTFADGFADEQAAFESSQAEGGRALTEQDRVVHALCRPDRLLDLVRRFTLFDGGEKKIARYQQFFAVSSLLRRVKTRDAAGRRQGGVIWHTQGSGKSLTMVMMARALALDPDITSPRVVLVTDRIDLDEQIRRTFAACGLEPQQAQSGRHLLELVDTDKAAIVTTLLNKFDTALRARAFEDPSPDVFLLVDESHRSQYGTLHPRMRKVFPNACFLGFTGTPLMKAEKSTFERFGGLIDVYAIRQAVEDKAVVPLLYEGRHVEQEVNEQGIDTWFDRTCVNLSAGQKGDLKRRFARARELSQTSQTTACIAFDVSRHFSENWKGTGFKGQLVAPSKRAALAYKKALDEMDEVTSEVIISGPDEREGYETIDAAPADDVLAFWKRMMNRFGDERRYNESVIESFKKREEPDLLIVVDKLLTGFDAPKNTILYIAKKMKEHTLLQAIARVNRVEEGKEFGFIIDYQGLLGALDHALTEYCALDGYDEEDVADSVIAIRDEIAKLPQRHSELWDVFREIRNKADEEAFERHLADEIQRKLFYERLARFAKTLAIALSSANYVNEPGNTIRIGGYKDDLRRFEKLRSAVKRRYQEEVSLRDYEPRIRKLLDTHILAHQVLTLTPLVNIFDDEAFAKAVADQGSTAAKADLIASAAKRTITERLDEDPAFYEKFSHLIQKVIDNFRQGRLDELEYLRTVSAIRDALVNRKTDDLPEAVRDDPIATAFYGVSLEVFRAANGSSTAELPTLAAEFARNAATIIEQHRIVDWVGNLDVQKAMANDIDDYLFDVVKSKKGVRLTPAIMDDLIERIMQIARHRLAK